MKKKSTRIQRILRNKNKYKTDAVIYAMEYIRRNRINSQKPLVEDESEEEEANCYWKNDEDIPFPSYETHEADYFMDLATTDTVSFRILKHLEKDLPPREILDFNILSHQEALLRSIYSSRNHYDDNVSLHKNLSCTKGEFARGALELFQQCNMTKKNQKKFWNFISNSLGKVINLPVRANLKTKRASQINREECTEDLFADTTIDMTDEYCKQQKKKRFLEFCQCENNCTIYLGKTKGKLFECPVCREPRFRPCTRSDCQNNGQHDCEHLRYPIQNSPL